MGRFFMRRRNSETPTCPYCKSDIRRGELLSVCAVCGTKHHAECARELTRCSTMGCAGKLPIVETITTRRPSVISAMSSTAPSAALGCLGELTFWVIAEAIVEILFGLLCCF